jgi:type II secretory pathway component PulF
LEGLAGLGSRLAESRRLVATAMVYPLFVLLLAWGLFALFTTYLAPQLVHAFQGQETPSHAALATLARWGKHMDVWGPAVPLVVIGLALAWWLTSVRAGLLESGWTRFLLGWVPWTGRMLRHLRTAAFADVLALLVENRVPLVEAMPLAAEASGDRRLSRAAEKVASRLESGAPLNRDVAAGTAMPPLLLWLMVTGQSQAALVPALRHAATTYRNRARHQAELTRVFLPVLLTVLIGGGATLAYALVVLGPWTMLLRTLAGP